MAARKPKSVTITIKPWYQTQLFAAIVAGLLGLSPTIYQYFQQKDIIRDNIGMTFLNNIFPGPFAFSTDQKNSYSVRLVGLTLIPSDSWILFNNGVNTKIKLGRGRHDGTFYAYIDRLTCDTTYFYRTEAIHEGRLTAGPVSALTLPRCSSPDEITKTEQDPNFLADRSKLTDPRLPIGHPQSRAFTDTH